MPDVYLTIATADADVQERLAEILELRGTDPDQRAMLERYTGDLELPDRARVLEVGCGTGPVSRYLATLPGVGAVVGIDPSPVFVQHALALADDPRLSFHVGDAQELPLPDASFDCVVFHTVLCHVERVEQALAEAHRVCRPGGTLAVFDGDYATATVATSENDPLQACMDATIEHLVHDPWLVRRLPRLLAEAGFELLRVDGHAYTTTGSEYMTSIVERGADALAAAGTVDARTADALKAEAAMRVATGRFFGHIAYASALARR
jgi:ubiquinone/menaquinone biosynthesis C-methylase UbiE